VAKRKRVPVMTVGSWPPPMEKSPNPVRGSQGGAFAACTEVGASTPGRARANSEVPWRPPFARGLQQLQMVHPTRNARGGARGLSATELPEREG